MYHTNITQFRFATPLGRTEETKLIRRARKGDEEAVKLLHSRFQLFLIRTCGKLARGWMAGDDADDIMAEANLGLMEAIRSFTPRKGARFVTWLYIVVRRFVLGYLSRRARLSGPERAGTASLDALEPGSRVPDPEPSWEAGVVELLSPGEILSKREVVERAVAAIKRWPKRDRQLFLHRALDGWTFDTLASFLPPGGPGGRREAAPRYRQLLAKLREEVLQ